MMLELYNSNVRNALSGTSSQLRNLPRMHYETLTGINMALEDVTRGPDFFDANADMAARRADLRSFSDADFNCPQAAMISSPRGVRMGEA